MGARVVMNTGQGDHEHTCGTVLTIGRSLNNHIALRDTKTSRNHALVRQLGDGKYYLVDLGSANGSYVNGKRVLVPCALADGDEIRVGDTLLAFRCEAAETASRTGPVEPGEQDLPTCITDNREVHELTVLVVDIRDYTRLSESLDVNVLGKVLGSWFSGISDIVERHDGVLDRFLGDSVMARWLVAEKDTRSSIDAALHTALDIHQACLRVNREFPDLPWPLRIGVGINTGTAVLGSLGTGPSAVYTALGDAVNMAFRFEAATRVLHSDVVIGPDSFRHLPKPLWQDRLQAVSVKGKDQPITVCTVGFDSLTAALGRTP